MGGSGSGRHRYSSKERLRIANSMFACYSATVIRASAAKVNISVILK
jgi:hypothetical protein